MSKTWFITGTSRGFGREWTEAALKRGDKVAATARNKSSLDDLVEKYGDNILPLELDVNKRDDDFKVVKEAFDHFGEINIIVNNAGYGHFGVVEEVSEEEARAQIETNLFGALWVTQAALPYLRKQGYGHILQVSSIGGQAAFAGIGMYHASKWGLEGFSEALSAEVKDFGISVTIIEPGGFSTDWSGDSAKHSKEMPEYEPIRESRKKRSSSNKSGDPKASADAIMKVVDAEHPPLRLLLGEFATQIIPQTYEDRLKVWSDWKDVSIAADG
jgi:NAD(P)-dependent dehydrogenase (short-subunit alcohol dehydrogenase family)